jgi:hypothetical protein
MNTLHPKLTLLICVLTPFNLACADLVTLKDGQQRVGHIAGQLENALLLEVQPAPTLPAVQLRFPIANIASLKFEKNPATDELLRLAATSDSPTLQELWERFRPLLKNADSPSAAIGLRYGLLLLNTQTPNSREDALTLFSLLAVDAPTPSERDAALQGTLRALLSLGKAQTAQTQSIEILKKTPSAPLASEANLTLATLADSAFRKFLEQHPRWKEDPFSQPEYHTLHHAVLDFYLTAALLPEAPPELTQRALLGAIGVHRLCKDLPPAAEIARDIALFFPGTPASQSATAFLQSLPASIPNTDIPPVPVPRAVPTSSGERLQNAPKSENQNTIENAKKPDSAATPTAPTAPHHRKRSRSGAQQDAAGPLP